MSILKGQMETHEGDILYPKTSFDMVEGVPNLASPNLLINSDFKSGIINQRGSQTYNVVDKYSIDRWILWNRNIELSVQSGYIRLKKTAASVDLLIIQLIDFEDAKNIPEKMCITFRAKASTNLKFELYETGRTVNLTTQWQTLSIPFTKSEIPLKEINGSVVTVYFGGKNPTSLSNGDVAAGTTIDVEFIKLEEGSHFTGMPIYNPSLEFIKCCRYYRSFDIDEKHVSTNASGSTFYIMFDTDVPMYKKPTTQVIKPSGVNNLSVVYGTNESTDININLAECTYWENRLYARCTPSATLKAWRLAALKATGFKMVFDSELYKGA